MAASGAGAFSPTDAAQAVRSIERLMAQRRFDEAAAVALRALQFEQHRRDVRLLLVRALIGARRFGEAADEALATLTLFPKDVAARTLLRTAVGRLHLLVRGVLSGADSRVIPPTRDPDDAVTTRHPSFSDDDLEATADEDPLFVTPGGPSPAPQTPARAPAFGRRPAE